MAEFGIRDDRKLYPDKFQIAYNEIVNILRDKGFTLSEAKTLFSIIENRTADSAKI